jgi:5-methyltetrahydrofolate--homocysteine methyltransferase
LAREAASLGEGVMVAGSMGPTGALFKPYGPLTPEEAVATYAEQARALTEGGVDFLLIETMFALDEAMAAVQGARQTSSLPIVVSFSYDRGVRTMMGVKPAQVVETFKPLGVVAIGANCGTTLENMEKLVNEYAAIDTDLAIWAKPNAGLPVMQAESATAVYEVTPEQMAEYASRNVQSGAQIIGGCCGSTPAHITAIAKAVKMEAARRTHS